MVEKDEKDENSKKEEDKCLCMGGGGQAGRSPCRHEYIGNRPRSLDNDQAGLFWT